MKRLILALALCAPIASVAMAADRNVVIPDDNKPFTVEQADIVRLTGKGIAGATIEAKITGPAKIDSTTMVQHRKDGHGVIGNAIKEFEIKGTGTGKVTVVISVKNPTASNPADVKFEYTIK